MDWFRNFSGFRNWSLRLSKVLLISLIFLLSCSSTPKTTEKTSKSETIINEKIVNNSFEIVGVAEIEPIFSAGKLNDFVYQPYISRLDTIIQKNTTKNDTLNIIYEHSTNKFNIKFNPEPDTLRETTIKEIEIIEVVKNVTNWYLIGLGIIVLILLLIFLVKK